MTMTTPLPLVIPEIAGHILALVDEDTINGSALFVCRLWYSLTRHRHIRETVWNNRYSSATGGEALGTDIDATLAKAHRLHCYIHSRAKDEEERQIYNQFREALIHIHNQQIGVPSRRLIGAQEQRAILEASGNNNGEGNIIADRAWNWDPPRRRHLAPGAPPLFEVVFELFSHLLSSRIYPLLPFCHSITNLTIRCVVFNAVNQLCMPHLLAWCPYLEHLKIDGNKCVVLSGPWFRPHEATWSTPLSVHHPIPTRLESFVAINAILAHGDLLDLLEVSPYLRDLRVVVSDNIDRRYLFDTNQFLHDARTFFSSSSSSSCSNRTGPMETFHVSTKGQSIDDTEIEERMFGLGPNATDITVQIQDFRPALLDVLGSRLNVITSLEIVNGDWVTSLELHRYLCESPHLLHLKAPRIAIIAEDLYTFSKTLNNADSTVAATEATATAATITGTGQQASGVWACRQLKTLHASFYSRHSFRAGEGGAGLCRHVFGYISRVCPRLSRLEISSMESMWQDDADAYPGKMYSGCMALESGLCLLARLKELRWILLGCNDSDPKVRNVDVSWIFLADETSLARKAERRQIVSSWAVDVETDLKRSQANNSSSSGSRRTEDMESELSERLQNLGTLLDVKRMIDEMDAIDNFECWPLLRGISICRQGGLGQSRRNELRRLLQETKVHDTVSYLPRLFACFPSEWAGG